MTNARCAALLFLLLAPLVADAALAADADLAITATSDRPRVFTGEPFMVTLHARNNGPAAAENVRLGVFFDAYAATVLSAKFPDGWNCTLDTTLSCTVPSFAAGAAATLVATVVAPDKDPARQGSANILPSGTRDPDFGNNVARFPTTVEKAPSQAVLSLRIVPLADPAVPLVPAVFDATVENRGPGDAAALYLTLANLTNGSLTAPGPTAQGPGWTCESRVRSALCRGPALPAGQTSRVQITLPAPANEVTVGVWGEVIGERISDPYNYDAHSVYVTAGDPANYELLLVPLHAYRVPGANGSLWQTDVTLFADESVPVYPRHLNCVIPEGCFPYETPAGRLYNASGDMVPLWPIDDSGVPASMVYTHRGDSQKLHFTLRVRDIAHPEASWGAAIPVVRESELRTSKLTIVDVPVTAAFRSMLRVYDPDSRTPPEAVVRIRDEAGNVVLEQRRRFRAGAQLSVTPGGNPMEPAYLQIDLTAELTPLLGRDARLVIEVEPTAPGQRLWAFASATSNETQEVTVLTPQ